MFDLSDLFSPFGLLVSEFSLLLVAEKLRRERHQGPDREFYVAVFNLHQRVKAVEAKGSEDKNVLLASCEEFLAQLSSYHDTNKRWWQPGDPEYFIPLEKSLPYRIENDLP